MNSSHSDSQITQLINTVQATTHYFEDDGSIPNNPSLPMLFYQGALRVAGDDPARVAEQVFTSNEWGGTWRNGIYTFHHYHSTAHEVLAICRGEAEVRFGGEQGVTVTVRAGDVAVLPAGTGHKNLGASADLLVVGAYPPGQHWDLCYGRPSERPEALDNIARVPLPKVDPVYGTAGPLVALWETKNA